MGSFVIGVMSSGVLLKGVSLYSTLAPIHPNTSHIDIVVGFAIPKTLRRVGALVNYF